MSTIGHGMQAIEPRQSATGPRAPGLEQFRINPFRVLQIAPSTTTEQALWQGEKMLARVRTGIAPDAEVVPWLAPATELEIMDAMQTIESPLARLVEQLLWFDFEADPRGEALRHALTGAHAAALHEYLLLEVGDAPPAARINQINLRLLLGLSELHGVGPRVSSPDVHDGWVRLIADAVPAWERLLVHPEVRDDLRRRLLILEHVDEERVTADDAEALSKAIRLRLADLVVAEVRRALQFGAVEIAGRFIQLARNSEIEPGIWRLATKPLWTQFRLELAAIPGRPSGTGMNGLAEFGSYIDRFAAVVARWRHIDAGDSLDLATPIDQAVDDILGRLRTCNTEMRASHPYTRILQRLAALAVSHSLRARIMSSLPKSEDDTHFRESDSAPSANYNVLGSIIITIIIIIIKYMIRHH